MTGTENTSSSEKPAIRSYCMLCRTGAELSVVQRITLYFPELEAIAPMKTLQEKRKGQWEQREYIMLPGYLFLYSERELPFDLCPKINQLYKILEYEKGTRMLTGEDEEYALWIYRHQGKIGTSKVIIEEGQAIQVIEGPLVDCRGTIIKLDKHKRRAIVAFSFDGQKRIVSISAECVLAIGSKGGNK